MNRTSTPTRTRILTAAALALTTAGLLFAGPLSPPAGPVTSTYKTLTEVEPRIAINATNTPGDADSLFKIRQPGSYYLTGNITGVINKHGIELDASGVTLDLNGFELRGIPDTLDGINVSAFDGVNIAVRNGSLRSWGDCGVDYDDNFGHPPAFSLTDLNAASNGRHGFSTPSGTRVAHCTSLENAGNGFYTLSNSSFVACIARLNGLDGFGTNTNCTFSDCTASSNTNRGFYTGVGSTLTNCTASGNASGFASITSIYNACSAADNTANGFDVAAAGTLNACNAHNNGGIGIDVSSRANVIACSANNNTGIGIRAASGTRISGCTVSGNLGVGIQVSGDCLVRDNNLWDNGGATVTFANIRATSTDNHIEGNRCSNAPIGIDVAGAGNIIIKNTCSDNTTNWVIAANNIYGPIVDRRIPAPLASTPAVNGNAAASTLGSTDPNANFSY